MMHHAMGQPRTSSGHLMRCLAGEVLTWTPQWSIDNTTTTQPSHNHHTATTQPQHSHHTLATTQPPHSHHTLQPPHNHNTATTQPRHSRDTTTTHGHSHDAATTQPRHGHDNRHTAATRQHNHHTTTLRMSCIGPSFSEQTKRGLKTPYHVVLVPPAGFKLEGVDAGSSGLRSNLNAGT